jgi:hypothetical protein
VGVPSQSSPAGARSCSMPALCCAQHTSPCTSSHWTASPRFLPTHTVCPVLPASWPVLQRWRTDPDRGRLYCRYQSGSNKMMQIQTDSDPQYCCWHWWQLTTNCMVVFLDSYLHWFDSWPLEPGPDLVAINPDPVLITKNSFGYGTVPS